MRARDFDATIRAGLRRLGWRLPLLDRMLEDRHVRLACRATDPGWKPITGIDVSVGFSPFERQLQVPARSPLALWSANDDPAKDARDFNASDVLVSQVLFLVHDYLHAWAFARIRECLPRGAAFLRRPIKEADLEHHVFCHLVSEAAATVGLDYWFLAERDLDALVGMGTNKLGLTNGFRLANLAEFQRHFSRGRLETASVRFFERFATFYCTGKFLGFGARDLARSPKLERWLTHELRYGESQRIFTRQWFSYLATGRRPVLSGVGRPVRCSERWQETVIREVGEALHALVHEQVTDPVTWPEYEPRSRRIAEIDLRFLNLRDGKDVARAVADPFVMGEQFPWFVAHRAARHRFPGDQSASADALPAVVDSKCVLLLERFLAGEEAVAKEPYSAEPEDLFLLG